MKKYIFFIVIYIIISNFLYADNLTIEKIHEFGFAQSFIYGGSFTIDYPYLCSMTLHGLEIYHINDNFELEKTSMVPLRASYNIIIKNNYAYISTCAAFGSNDRTGKLYQVDISDKYNPSITDSLTFNDLHVAGLEIFGDQLYFGLSPGTGLDEACVYSIPDFEFLCNVDTNLYLQKVNDSLAIDHYNSTGGANFYDVSDMTNIQWVGGQEFGTLSPSYCQCISDTVVFSTNQHNAMIWDISDIGNWELMSHYIPQYTLTYGNNFIVFDNYALLINPGYLEAIDISDLHSIQPVDTACTYSSACAAAYYDNKIFVGTRDEGIQTYNFSNDMLTYDDNYFEYPSFWTSYAYDNYLFAQTWRYGVYLFDVSNPEDPQEIPTILGETYYKELRGYKNFVWIIDVTDFSYRIYDISNPENPILRNIIPIGDYYQIYWSYLRFDGDNIDEVYVFYRIPTKLQKYDISEPGNTQLLFEYTGVNGYSFVVKDEIGYVTNEVGNFQELMVLGGLGDNDPYIQEYYPSFLTGGDDGFLQLCNEYLCTRNEPTKFFSLDSPYEPEFLFELEYSASSGLLNNWNNIVFADIGVDSYVYYLNESKDSILNSIDLIQYYTYLQDMSFYETSTSNYLFAVEESAIEVFEFTYDIAVDDQITENVGILQCNPNPFSTSTTISIKFNHPTSPPAGGYVVAGELSQIKIYNIKGQLVRTLPISSFPNPSLGMHKLVWDGKDESGKDIKSGVYLYKLSSNDEFIGKVVKLK